MMEGPRGSGATRIVGYLVVLLGVAGWVVSCFLPLFRVAELPRLRVTLYRQLSYGSIGIRLGGFLYLFGGIAAIGVISAIGIWKIRRWNGAVLAGAAAAWFLASSGALITLGSTSPQLSPGASLAVGYWCLWASVACVVVGTVMVLLSTSRWDQETSVVLPHEQGSTDPNV